MEFRLIKYATLTINWEMIVKTEGIKMLCGNKINSLDEENH